MSEFPWSKSGLQLLEIINKSIESEGGIISYYEAVLEENERSGRFVCPDSRGKMIIKISKMYGHVSLVEMAEILEIPTWRVSALIEEIMDRGFIPDTRKVDNRPRKNYYKKKPEAARFPYTDAEVEYIKKMYPTTKSKDIGEYLGRSKGAIDNFINRHFPGLKKKKESNKFYIEYKPKKNGVKRESTSYR